MAHDLPTLPYKYDALEPFIDKVTMEIHHSKHHKAYVDKFKAAIQDFPDLKRLTTEEILRDIETVVPEEIRNPVRNNGGGHFNHSFFWQILKREVEIMGEIAEAINIAFGDFEKFKEAFSAAAIGQFGSGWAWLILNENGELEIVSTANQNCPLSVGKIPLLCIDVWEHAYYITYQNKRNEYVENFFNCINWDVVNENFLAAKQGLNS